MARIRTIKPEFCTSEQLVECSTSARLLFVLMWMFCDDRGVHPAKARQLKMECFPGDPFTVEDVEGWIQELLTVGLIEEFIASSGDDADDSVSQDVRYWHVTGWDRHQRIDRPTKPKHPEPRRGLVEGSSSEERGLALEGKGREGKGKDLSSARFTPPTVEEVTSYCLDRPHKIDAQTFVDFYTAKGWMVGKNRMKDWRAAVRTWERNRVEGNGASRVATVEDAKDWVP